MIRHLLLFAACFVAGALTILVLRAIDHEPYAEAAPAAAPAVAPPAPAAPAAAPADPHAGHAAAPAAADAKPVNTRCAICGMRVDPSLGTAIYQGKVIGFGCKACPEEFRKNPDRYGPAALADQVVEE